MPPLLGMCVHCRCCLARLAWQHCRHEGSCATCALERVAWWTKILWARMHDHCMNDYGYVLGSLISPGSPITSWPGQPHPDFKCQPHTSLLRGWALHVLRYSTPQLGATIASGQCSRRSVPKHGPGARQQHAIDLMCCVTTIGQTVFYACWLGASACTATALLSAACTTASRCMYH